MIHISISPEFRDIIPQFAGASIYTKVENSEYNEELWREIETFSADYKNNHTIEDIKRTPVIAATRQAYKKFGKDPNRYRPSAESLCRRIIRGLPLYQVNTLVDLINLVSIRTGFSIGGFDANKISGNQLTLGIGKEAEPYEGIGRGILNIEGLPVYRDMTGGIGTPTSDHERTKIELNTTSLFTIINGYNGKENLEEAINYMQSLLKLFAKSESETVLYF